MNKFAWIQFYFILGCFLTFYTVSSIADDSLLDITAVGPETEMVNTDQYEQIIYVSMERGSDKKGDGQKENPYQTVIKALSRIEGASEDNRVALFVAAGKYDNGTVVMKEYVDLFGGFDPVTWARDIETSQTVLDGEAARRVVVAASHAKIDGFIVANGLSMTHGGGILCDDTSPLISNNYIINNAVIEPSDFNHHRIHQEGHHGGGIACLYNAVPEIRNNVFYGNRTFIGYGAGVVFYGWLRSENVPSTSIENNVMTGGIQPQLYNNVFVGNISGVNDLHRTRSSSGGAIACAFEARPVISNNLIINNEAKGRSDAGGIYSEYFSYPLIKGNWILGNISDDDGGGFYTMKLGDPVLEKNIFAGNWTRGGGAGAIRLSKEGRARVTENLIVGNPGGGVISVDSYLELENNIIMNNTGASGISYSNVFSYMQPSIIRHNIIRDNEKGAFVIKQNAGPDPLLQENNVDDQTVNQGDYNVDEQVEFIDDGLKGGISKISFDPVRVQSQVEITNPDSISKDLTGRIIRIGERWGVICSSNSNSITAWGDLYTTENQEMIYEILPSYSEE